MNVAELQLADDIENETTTNTNENDFVSEDDIQNGNINVIDQIRDDIYRQMTESLKLVKESNGTIKTSLMYFKNDDGHNDEYDGIWKRDSALQLVKAKRNGDCLFSVVVFQLYGHNIQYKKHNRYVKKMRDEVVNYIKSKIYLFEFDLQNRIYSEKSKKVKDMKKQCFKFVDKKLSKSGTWAGMETLRAIGNLHKVNILVVNEQADYSFANGFDRAYDRIIFMAFRNNMISTGPASNTNRNHYDSIAHIDEDDLATMAKNLAIEENTHCE